MSKEKREFEDEIFKKLEELKNHILIVRRFLYEAEEQRLAELNKKLKDMTFRFNFYIFSAIISTIVNLTVLFLLSLFLDN